MHSNVTKSIFVFVVIRADALVFHSEYPSERIAFGVGTHERVLKPPRISNVLSNYIHYYTEYNSSVV